MFPQKWCIEISWSKVLIVMIIIVLLILLMEQGHTTALLQLQFLALKWEEFHEMNYFKCELHNRFCLISEFLLGKYFDCLYDEW